MPPGRGKAGLGDEIPQETGILVQDFHALRGRLFPGSGLARLRTRNRRGLSLSAFQRGPEPVLHLFDRLDHGVEIRTLPIDLAHDDRFQISP